MKSRKKQALEVRIAAAELAHDRVHPVHKANGDERRIPRHAANFTKGLPHCAETGLLLEVPKRDLFEEFVRGIDSGDPQDFKLTALGPHKLIEKKTVGGSDQKLAEARLEEDFDEINGWNWRSSIAQEGEKGAEVRAWESASAGNTFDLEGPDSHSVTMPPAPAVGSDELIAEMAEVYAQALLRDVPFSAMGCKEKGESSSAVFEKYVALLNKLPWFSAAGDCCSLSPEERARKRKPLNLQTAFRGIARGDDVGPYLSQFLLIGNASLGKTPKGALVHDESAGFIRYGAIRIDQRVRTVTKKDFMTTWEEWLDVQNGAKLGGKETYEGDGETAPYRFITTPRDLATYVHYDALYESYLNACLILMARDTPFDPGIPYQTRDHVDHQQGFAHFGGPHILSLVTEVATRALKAVRYQKFNIHRRMRPEVLAARLEKASDISKNCGIGIFDTMLQKFEKDAKPILTAIREHNEKDLVYTQAPKDNGTLLLPMAFPEGSPMHPSYGAGHATVAGACVTILKAFFDHSQEFKAGGKSGKAYVANNEGTCLELVDVHGADCKTPACLTVEGELNKLAANISIGRDWAGVHYFSDYWESLLMGEQVALGILEEQKLTYGETFSMTVPLFGGGSVRI